MGSNFFSKVASIDPLAQALNLPGAHKYAQAQAQDVQTNAGPYAGITPALADAQGGYALSGPHAQVGWTPNQASAPGNALFGNLQRFANLSGNVSAHPNFNPPGMGASPGSMLALPNPGAGTRNTYVQGSQTVNPYVTAARNATQQQTWGQ